VGTRGLRGVTVQVFSYLNKILIYIYIYINTYFIAIPRGKVKKGKRKSDGADGPKLRVWRPSQAQSHGPAPKANASSKRFKMRSTASRISRAYFRSWGVSWMGIMPRSTSMPEICMTCHDSHSGSMARSLSILSRRAWALSSSADRSCLSGGCRPRSSSSTSIASRTSRSVSCRQRRVWHSSSVRSRSLSRLDWELEAHT
jgi:hypothetical protein